MADLEEQVLDLTAAAERDAAGASSTTSAASADKNGWMSATSWKEARSVDREKLWKYLLGGFPYVNRASMSRGALLLTKGTKKGKRGAKPKYANGFYEAGECTEVDVVVVSNKPGVCLAVFDSRLPIYTTLRVDGTRGVLLEAQLKAASPKLYKPKNPGVYTDAKLAGRALILGQSETRPKPRIITEAADSIGAFVDAKPKLLREVQALITERKLGRRQGTVVVMVTNLGTLDLVANFICSCHSSGLARALESTLVFAADDDTRLSVEHMGVAAYYSAGLGELPTEAATNYGDYAFTRMMWLKTTSVFLVSALKYSVIFQDADVVWLRDPIDFFWAPETADLEVDTVWMDDGARSMRFTPFYANSGFYFIRSNDRTRLFMYRMLMSYDDVLAQRSHQSALITLLLEHVARYGLTANVLDASEFPQGAVFHHDKDTIQDFVDGRKEPWLFHMCWTASRTDKLRFFKNLGLWFLQPTCDLARWQGYKPQSAEDGNKLDASKCCLGNVPWSVPTPYTDVIITSSRPAKAADEEPGD
mmetsp:Transcript_7062/g.22936  ORF Transcript_7062/g.22936 Transcript_7062/m.22936 type:complete len:533 (-) Transcript_7062:26-1624(-)